ncbi:uncharacterized protein K489DRAFT_380478 [Dissoconium aciculare CBS 342.82]|uniref:Uncharacterized protein n=1 Tax=Dissoconium aciculare CBS 342.82 TaxID=1314786 RepID=A0A6J3M4Y3_9PEZI|nr:uncharacterized protein K489DRAFT_380478 [Dissoconium aciculare CBS 342.82]KAF1823090.1 hypothetical protein K489DRAFT_380478 [Dissoconium aciculare CBS 342.82]
MRELASRFFEVKHAEAAIGSPNNEYGSEMHSFPSYFAANQGCATTTRGIYQSTVHTLSIFNSEL